MAPAFFRRVFLFAIEDGRIPDGNTPPPSDPALGVLPAIVLDKTKILFASDAEGGKPSAVSPDLTAVTASSAEMKLTILDSNLSLQTTATSRTVNLSSPDRTVRIPYTGAATGAGRYVSCAILKPTGTVTKEVLYYGKLVNLASGSGSGEAIFNLPAGLPPGSYNLFVFNEQCSVDYYTDYASTPADIALTVVDLPIMGGSVTITGAPKYGETLAANTTGITYTPSTSGDVPTYQWMRGGEDGVTIAGAAQGAVGNVAAALGGDNRTVNIANDAFANNEEVYAVTIPADAVRNSGGIGNAAITWSFTTAAAQVALPAAGSAWAARPR